MSSRNVLVPMFNHSPWGGLHENIWYAARGMKAYGWNVTVACRPGPLVEKLTAEQIDVHVIEDWDDREGDIEALSQREWEVIHSHTGRSRVLGRAVRSATGARLVNTFHGYHVSRDRVHDWAGVASALIGVSRSHARMIEDADRVDPTKVYTIPNGVRDELFDQPMRSLDDKLSDGPGQILVASRLGPDKTALLECVDKVTDALVEHDREWVIRIAGDGDISEQVRDFIGVQAAKSPRLRFEMTGWVESEEIPVLMRDAVLTVASGRGAMQSLAVGTPTVAFGSQGVYGLQRGQNLRIGLWGNFGGHPLGDMAVSDVTADTAASLAKKSTYGFVQTKGRAAASSFLRQSDVDRALDAVYRL